MNNMAEILGIVHNGEFVPVEAGRGPALLTTIAAQAAQSPESAALDVMEHEGQAIMVRGHDQGGVIYSASVTEAAGPILTAVVRKAFAPNE